MSVAIYESHPGSGFWRRDNAHFPIPMSRYLWELFAPAHYEGSRIGFERYGCAIDRVDFARIKGRIYGGIRFVGCTAELRRRAETAERASQSKLWRQDRSQWQTIGRHMRARLLDCARRDVGAMDTPSLRRHIA